LKSSGFVRQISRFSDKKMSEYELYFQKNHTKQKTGTVYVGFSGTDSVMQNNFFKNGKTFILKIGYNKNQ